MSLILPKKQKIEDRKSFWTFQSPISVPATWNIRYVYESIAKAYSRDEGPKFRDDLISRPLIVELVKLYGSGKELIDLGCGDGHISRLISPYCKKVLGVDISMAMLSQAQSKSQSFRNVSFQKANFLNLQTNFPYQRFDLALGVFAFCCVKNVSQLDWAFRNIYQILREEGVAIIQVPDENEQFSESKSEWIKELPYGIDDVARLVKRSLRTIDGTWVNVARYHYRQKDYLESIRKAGFQIKEIHTPKADQTLLIKYASLKHETEITSSTIWVLKK